MICRYASPHNFDAAWVHALMSKYLIVRLYPFKLGTEVSRYLSRYPLDYECVETLPPRTYVPVRVIES